MGGNGLLKKHSERNRCLLCGDSCLFKERMNTGRRIEAVFFYGV
jgi:DNA-directed RNA polymerase subunit RPC12/RpoP